MKFGVKFASVVVAATLIGASTGCDAADTPPGFNGDSAAPTTTTTSPQAAPTTGANGLPGSSDADYSHLLLQPADLSDRENTFAVRSTIPAPDELPGASALFVNTDDTRAISNTIVIYPDAQTATSTLDQALTQVDTVVIGDPEPVPVGTGGTMIAGTSADGSKAITLLLFTQGPAMARLQFESALGDVTGDSTVISVGKMQQIALRVGLAPTG